MVKQFRDEFKFLSNFYITPITYRGSNYRSVEHAFQASKCTLLKDKMLIKNTSNPAEVRSLGRQVNMRDTWHLERISVMTELLRIKFNNPDLQQRLIKLDGEEIVEGNFHHDTFWGQCFCRYHKGAGDNQLGKILMLLVNEFVSNKKLE